jgi:hypothetical protein
VSDLFLDDEDRQEKKAKEELERAQHQLFSDYQQIFVNNRCQQCRGASNRILLDLLGKTHVFSSIWTGNSKMYRLEGERRIGLYLLAMCEMASMEGIKKLRKIANS